MLSSENSFRAPEKSAAGPSLQRRRSSRQRASVKEVQGPPWACLSEKVQELMRKMGLEGWSACDAHAHLQQLLYKSETEEAAARRKFRKARRRHVRCQHALRCMDWHATSA